MNGESLLRWYRRYSYPSSSRMTTPDTGRGVIEQRTTMPSTGGYDRLQFLGERCRCPCGSGVQLFAALVEPGPNSRVTDDGEHDHPVHAHIGQRRRWRRCRPGRARPASVVVVAAVVVTPSVVVGASVVVGGSVGGDVVADVVVVGTSSSSLAAGVVVAACGRRPVPRWSVVAVVTGAGRSSPVPQSSTARSSAGVDSGPLEPAPTLVTGTATSVPQSTAHASRRTPHVET